MLNLLASSQVKIFSMEQNKKTKRVKLQPRYRSLAYRQKIVPELKLSGVWLEELGFKPGSEVSITIREELLIITAIKP